MDISSRVRGFAPALAAAVIVIVVVGVLGLGAVVQPMDSSDETLGYGESASTSHQAGDERTLTITEEAFPGTIGSYLVPVEVTAPAHVRVSFDTILKDPQKNLAGFGHILAYEAADGEIVSIGNLGTVTSDDATASVNHEGKSIQCCPGPPEGDGDTFEASWARTVTVTPGTTLYVGMAAVGWTSTSKHTATVGIEEALTEEDATFTRGELLHGEHAEAIDLVAEAERHGTNVQHEQTTLAGDTAKAHVSLEPETTGLVFLRVDQSGEASGDLTVQLPNGTLIERGTMDDSFGSTHPYRGSIALTSTSGPVSIQLENASDPRQEPSNDDPGTLSAIAVFADLPLPIEGITEQSPLLSNPSAVQGQASGDVHERGDELLPDSTGWFLIPITTEEDQRVMIRTEALMDTQVPGPRGAVAFFQAPVANDEAPYDEILRSHSTWVPAASPLEATLSGEDVRCCPETQEDRDVSDYSGAAARTMHLEAGETIHAGFVAYDWHANDHFKLQITSSQAPLDVGEPRQGTEVDIADLFHEAYDEGTNARLYGSPVVGDPADARTTLTTTQGGFLAAGWDLSGGADADIHIEAPGGLTLATALPNEEANRAAFTPAGMFNASIEEAYQAPPRPGQAADGTRPDGMAMVLVADIDLNMGIAQSLDDGRTTYR